MVKSKQWLLAKKPTDMPQLDGADQTFRLEETSLPDPKDGEVLVKLLYLSNDPAQRTWILKDADPHRLYAPPVKEGTPMRARGLVEVVESKSSDYKKGDHAIATIGWTEYRVLSAGELQPAPDLPNGMSETHYLGALGLTGLTAYAGLKLNIETKPDDIVVVSGAAGATGMMAVQIAKHIIGCKKVIGIAGTDDKCRWVESLGADLCLNYKKDSFKSDLAGALPGPDGFADVYFDNVGGSMLDLMLDRMAKHGRVSACGAISNYNNSPDRMEGLKNWFNVIFMRLVCKGFIVTDFTDRFPHVLETLRAALKEGKLNLDRSETVRKGRFEDVPKTWMTLFDGGNTGKLVTAIE